MTESLAALLGAIVGGLLSAWVGSWQTAKVLKHETDLASTERQEAQHADETRRQSVAADQLIEALALYLTTTRHGYEYWALFTRLDAVGSVQREREDRAAALLQAGASHAHALSEDLRGRWDALTWMVRYNQSEQVGLSEELRRRDGNDLINYAEYVRRSLSVASEDPAMPPLFPAPNVRRDGLRRWGYQPPEGANEPDMSDWHFSSQLVGRVTLMGGAVRWYGPDGIEEISEAPETLQGP